MVYVSSVSGALLGGPPALAVATAPEEVDAAVAPFPLISCFGATGACGGAGGGGAGATGLGDWVFVGGCEVALVVLLEEMLEAEEDPFG